MALASCPARQGQQRSLQRMRQDLSAFALGAQPGMRAVASFWEAGGRALLKAPPVHGGAPVRRQLASARFLMASFRPRKLTSQVQAFTRAAASGTYPNLAAALAAAGPVRSEDDVFESCIQRLIDVARPGTSPAAITSLPPAPGGPAAAPWSLPARRG